MNSHGSSKGTCGTLLGATGKRPINSDLEVLIAQIVRHNDDDLPQSNFLWPVQWSRVAPPADVLPEIHCGCVQSSYSVNCPNLKSINSARFARRDMTLEPVTCVVQVAPPQNVPQNITVQDTHDCRDHRMQQN